MNPFQRAIRSCLRKPIKSLLLLLVIGTISLLFLSGMASRSANIAAKDSTRQAIGAGFLLEGNPENRSKRLQEAFEVIEETFGVGQSGSYQGVHAETIISNGQPSGYVWTDHSFESLVREDIEKIAAASGISDYNITTVPTPVKPEGFSRIEDPDKDQTLDPKGISLVGNRTMSLDSNVLNGIVTIKDGRMTVPQDQDVCVISEELALLNHLTVGDRIGFSPVKQEGPIQYAEIVGIYQVREPMTPYMSGDTYRSENIIFTNLDFPAKAEQDSPLFEKAYFKVEQVDEYEAVKERIQQTDINWERYDLIDNNGNLDTMASNFNDLEHISQMLLLIIASASFIILSLIFVFWMKSRTHEIGVLMSLGISKLEILFQMILEAFLIGIVAVSLSFLAAPMAAKTAAEYLVVQQEQQAQLQEDQTANQIQTEYVAPELTVTDVQISLSPSMFCADGISIALLTLSSVSLAGVTIFRKKPREILSEMS